MKKLVILLFISLSVHGQEPWMRTTPSGIFIHFNSREWAGQTVDVKGKKPGESAFRSLQRVQAPGEVADLRKNMEAAKRQFPSLVLPSDQDLQQQMAKFKAKDKTFIAAIALNPLLSYVYGLAYLDTENTGTYTLESGTGSLAVKRMVQGFPGLTLDSTLAFGRVIGFNLDFPHLWKDLVQVEVWRKTISQTPDKYRPALLNVGFTADNKLLLRDTTLSHFGAYDYKIKLGDIFGNKDTADYFFQADNIPKEWTPDVKNVTFTSSPEARELTLKWEVEGAEYAQSLVLFRSREYDRGYKKVAVLSPGDKRFTDPVEVANELYFYYFEVQSIFGHRRKTRHFLSTYEGNELPIAPYELNLDIKSNRPVLRWKAADKISRGFYVFRKEGSYGAWEQISPVLLKVGEETIFTDSTSLDPRFNYFYAVKAESDNYTLSALSEPLFYQSTAPIKPPYDIHAAFSEGKVRLVWEENEQGVGYQIYRRQKGDYVLLTPISLQENTFIDSLVSESLHFEYTVVAVKDSGEKSAASLPVKVDIFAQLIPEDLGYQTDAKGVLLQWTAFDTAWVSEIKIQRAEDNGNIQTISTLTPNILQFKDQSAKAGKSYTYQLVTRDKEGNEYITTPLSVKL